MAQPKRIQNNLLIYAVRKTVSSVAEHAVAKSAAALTYHMLFAMFPLLIFISNLLGLLDLNVTSITNTLLPIMPDDVVYLLEAYLNHVTDNSSPVMFWFSLVFTIWFPMQAARQIMDDVRVAYQLGKPSKPVFYAVRQFAFTMAFLLLIGIMFMLAVLGRRFLSTLTHWLELEAIIQLPTGLPNLWQYLRFVLLAVMMFGILALLYAVAQDKRQPFSAILPGVAVAMAAWLLVSIGFSVYVENFATYSLIYGTLGAVIMLLVWLYMTAFILILGAEFNAALIAVRREAAQKTTL